MKQLTQRLRDGSMAIRDVPLPAVGPNDVLVRTHFSFVSVGTERMKISQARLSMVGKARERPDQVRQVVDTLREQGVVPTIRKVQERLAAPSTLGYSTSGVVEAIGAHVDEFTVGERVAAIGEGIATHAEYNAIPRTLVVPVPLSVDLEVASSSAIGAIAIQAIRQAELELGGTVAVIGLGLLGQFLVQLCRANGCRVVGIDIDEEKRTRATSSGAWHVCGPGGSDALSQALQLSRGQGVDVVFLTVSTKDIQPIELAADIVRDRGRVVCLGNTAISLDWRTWFGKEIDFRFSRAMGNGIFDPDYFRGVRDYPIGYVRWTANRNMQAFLDLSADNSIDIRSLITHRFDFEKATLVFDRIASGDLSSAIGIVLRYPHSDDQPIRRSVPTIVYETRPGSARVRVGQIGAGNYAKSMLMPHFSSIEGLELEAVCTTKGANADALAKRYDCRYATTDPEVILADSAINAVLIATRHDSHAGLAAAALHAGKHTFVEKPLALSDEQLSQVTDALATQGGGGATLFVGHNRRFSVHSEKLLSHFEGVDVRHVSCTVRAASVPSDSWYHDPASGGGMLFGDVCHFIDLCVWFQASLPVAVSAFAETDPSHREDTWAILISFANGGTGLVHYAMGSKAGMVEREIVDVVGGGRSARIVGFKAVELDGSSPRFQRRLQPDLGQKQMLEAMSRQFARHPGSPDLTESFLVSAQALLAARRSISERRVVEVEQRSPYRLR